MSGILLPGQDKKPAQQPQQPAGGSGLQIAGGFVKKKEEPKPQVENAAPAPAPVAETPTPPSSPAATPSRTPQARGRSAQDFLFPPQPAQIQCPNCGTPFVVPIFSLIDLSANPELKSALLSGQVNFAACPQCGYGGPLSAPLMVHSPEHQWLGVYIAAEMRGNDVQKQKMIGDLSQALMRKLPTEQRKGYMLQPKQYSDWQRFTEKIWEFEGVTPEMLRRQREQSALLQNLLSLANDKKALEIAISQRGSTLIDRTFFAMLDRMLMMASAQGQGEPFALLRANLLEMTEAGKEIKAQTDRIRAILGTVTAETTRAQVLEKLLEAGRAADGREIVGALVSQLAPALDYEFLLLLNERHEKSEDAEAKQQLEEIRSMILTLQEQARANQQAMVQQVQQVLQEVLQAEDLDAKLRELAEYIDESFLGVLAGNIQAAEQRGSKAAATRLKQVYDRAIAMLESNMPPEMRLLNNLLNANDRAETNKILQENRQMLTPDFVEQLKHLEAEMRNNRRTETADRIKSLRGQITLML